MKTEEIIDRLRNPQKYNPKAAQPRQTAAQTAQTATHTSSAAVNLLTVILFAGILATAAGVWFVMINAKSRAENISAAVDSKTLQGLTLDADFNPTVGVTYVQVSEGQDRNVAVDELGTTLPIINRFNYQSITPKNYGIIGMAPWALTENFAANINDVELMRYLLNRKEVADAFAARTDVAPLLEDPQLLAAFAQDTTTLTNFFQSDVVKQVLANPEMVRKIGSSRLMSQLLISKALRYYRTHPQEAAKIISASPVLNALRQNPGVRQAVEENKYLKQIAPQLLGKTRTTVKK